MAKWTEDVTYKFVQEFLKHECLYSHKDPNKKNKAARELALLELSEAMNIPGFESKDAYTKIRSLKSTYYQELKKIKQRTKIGGGKGAVYIPQIKWFKLMDDALNAVNGSYHLHTQLQGDMELNYKYKYEILQEEEPSTSQHNEYSEENSSDTPADPQDPLGLVKTSNLNDDEQRKSPVPRKRPRTIQDLVNKLENIVDTVKTSNQETETEFDIFGRSIAAQLQSMPFDLAIQAQMFIQNYLCNLRLQHMGHGHSTSNYMCSTPELERVFRVEPSLSKRDEF